jgi:uroporphyrinogen-III synthase
MEGWPHLQDIPIYTVGPATSRTLKLIPQIPPLNVFGSDSGNGEALAHYILEHYGGWYAGSPSKPPLLFLVGEQRRDIIPKTLMNPALPENKHITVDELVVYETGVMETFEQDFSTLLSDTENRDLRWIVMFSPTGCEAMLKALDMLDSETGKVKTGDRGGGCGNRRGKGRRTTYIATIGPTTRDYLWKTFGFEPDVCAAKPSPEGIGEAIDIFMEKICKE